MWFDQSKKNSQAVEETKEQAHGKIEEVKTASQDLNKAKRESDKSRRILEHLNLTLEKKEKDLYALNNEIDQIKKSLEAQNEDIELKSLLLKEKELELKVLRKSNHDLKLELSNTKHQLGLTHFKLEQEQKNLEREESLCERLEAELGNLESGHGKKILELAKLEADLEVSREEVENKKESIKELKNRLNDCSVRVLEQQNFINQNKKDFLYLNAKISKLKALNSLKEDAFRQNVEKLEDQETYRMSLEKRSMALQLILDRKQDRLNYQNIQIEALRASIKMEEKELEDMRGQIGILDSKIDSNSINLSALKEKNQKLNLQNINLQKKKVNGATPIPPAFFTINDQWENEFRKEHKNVKFESGALALLSQEEMEFFKNILWEFVDFLDEFNSKDIFTYNVKGDVKDNIIRGEIKLVSLEDCLDAELIQKDLRNLASKLVLNYKHNRLKVKFSYPKERDQFGHMSILFEFVEKVSEQSHNLSSM